MMNVINPASNQSLARADEADSRITGHSCLPRSLSEGELFIDFNAIDTVSVTFDESELSLSSGKSSRCDQETRQEKTNVVVNKALAVLDDATAATVASSTSFITVPQTKNTMKKSVSFGSLSIHSHALEMGGSGVPGSGPAITLGWDQESSITLPSVEEYEDARPCLPRRGIEMLQPRKQRVNMLLESGYTYNQIRVCSQECESIRKQRTKTVQQLSFSDRTKSTLKKLVVWKKSRPTEQDE